MTDDEPALVERLRAQWARQLVEIRSDGWRKPHMVRIVDVEYAPCHCNPLGVNDQRCPAFWFWACNG